MLAREESAVELLAFLRRQGFARIQMPFGDTHLAELPEGPLVLIAAGTGMAQMHSLIEYCRAAGFPHPVHLYWRAAAGGFLPIAALGRVAGHEQSAPAPCGQRRLRLGRALRHAARGDSRGFR